MIISGFQNGSKNLRRRIVMGMGHAAAYADVIAEEEVKKRCPLFYQEFLDALEAEDISIEEFAMEAQYDNGESLSDKVAFAYGKLIGEFKHNTGGLMLGMAHHQSDEYGDRYDEVDGTYFYVDGMYELTEAGEKMKDIVERKMFVQFG
jgi:hypothetical protein